MLVKSCSKQPKVNQLVLNRPSEQILVLNLSSDKRSDGYSFDVKARFLQVNRKRAAVLAFTLCILLSTYFRTVRLTIGLCERE